MQKPNVSFTRIIQITLIAFLTSFGVSLFAMYGRDHHPGPLPNTTRADSYCVGEFDPLLAEELMSRWDAVRIFSWGGLKTDGSVSWIDKGGRLQRAGFTKINDRYQVRRSQDSEKHFMTAEVDQTSYAEYLQDIDLPVKSDLIDSAGCRATIVLLWRARMRCFRDQEDKFQDVWPSVRLVVTRGPTLVSNTVIDYNDEFPIDVLLDDVNGDGVKDWVFSAGLQSMTLNIWTFTDTCVFQPLTFIQEGSKDRRDFLEDRSVYLKKDYDGTYSIHAAGPSLKPEYYDHIYKWSSLDKAFRRATSSKYSR